MKLQDLKNELNNEKQLTENGAVGYRTTGKELLNLNFFASSLRHMSDGEIYDKFIKAFYEDKLLAIKWLYFLRDCRGGLGERRSFRVILQNLAHDHPELVKQLISITAEYGRFDDLWCLLDTDLRDEVIKYCYLTFLIDIKNCQNDKSITLLSKWLPSTFSKKKNYQKYAKMFEKGFNLTKKDYNKALSILRQYSNVVECKMSNNKWSEINYEQVPSKANLLYKDAFMKHEPERRKAYLDSLVKGEAKINSSVLFPHDIVHNYSCEYWGELKPYDQTLESLWDNLPDYVNGNDKTICVVDGSGSMWTRIDPNANTSAIEVANALGIYFSQNLKGEYKDSFITFSSKPQLVNMSNCESLRDKLELAYKYDECSNTNIEAVFDLILNVAIKNGYTQDDLPENILILSDMEFDGCTYDNSQSVDSWGWAHCGLRNTLFEEIANKYAAYGYKLPSLAFWNLCSRTGTIPMNENEMGVKLISGFSATVVKMVLSNKTDPYEVLLEQLNSERYDAVEEAFNKAKI